MITCNIRVIVDINSGNAVWTDCGRKIGEGEVTDLSVALVTDVGLDPRTSLADKRPCDVVDG